MFRNYLKIALRNILKSKGYSFICIMGLTLGMLVAFIVMFLLIHEMSYDSYQKDADRTFIYYAHIPKIDKNMAYSPIVLASTLKNKCPEIESIAQVREMTGDVNLVNGKDYYKLDNIYFADTEICRMLSFNYIAGNANSFNEKPNSVIISRNTFEKYFPGKKDIIGSVIQIKFYDEVYLVEISGIYENVPENSQFRPDIVINNQLYKDRNKDILANWGYRNFVTYVHLKNNVNKNEFFYKANALLNNSYTEATGDNFKLDHRFLPLEDVHLYSTDIEGLFGKKGNINKLYVYLAIGLLTLLIGCINFINISTAKSSVRAKEIGVRKVVGASRQGIVFQLLTESVLIAFISFPITFVLFELLKPTVAEYFDRSFEVNYIDNWQYLIGLLSIVLFVGVFSGLNSALIASKQTPIHLFKSQNRINSSRSYFRRILITFQFVIFSGMLVCSYVIYSQMKYLKNGDIGYNKNNLIALLIPNGKYSTERESFVRELKQSPAIIDASITSSIPPSFGNRLTRVMKSNNIPDKEMAQYQLVECDENYKNVLGVDLKDGKFFDETAASVEPIQAVINETAEKELGFKQPIGEIVEFNGKKIRIVGILKDFNYNPLYEPITPMVFLPTKDMLAGVVIRVDSKDISASIDAIKEKWNMFFPGYPFSFKFVDEELDKIYRKDQLFGTLITCFTIIATLIAVIGLAGLVAFTTSRRVKEIGVRKILGAPVHEILFILLKEIFLILVIGCIVSFPLAHYFMKDWLTTFTYRTEITSSVYFIVFFTTLLIAIMAVGFQVMKAAIANPVEALKYE